MRLITHSEHVLLHTGALVMSGHSQARVLHGRMSPPVAGTTAGEQAWRQTSSRHMSRSRGRQPTAHGHMHVAALHCDACTQSSGTAGEKGCDHVREAPLGSG